MQDEVDKYEYGDEFEWFDYKGNNIVTDLVFRNVFQILLSIIRGMGRGRITVVFQESSDHLYRLHFRYDGGGVTQAIADDVLNDVVFSFCIHAVRLLGGDLVVTITEDSNIDVMLGLLKAR